MRPSLRSFALAALLTLTSAAQAALHDRGGGLIYDDVLDITWLQDANYAKTSGYDSDGLMTWAAATTWAANLVYGGHSDWRLPTMVDTGTLGCNSANSGTDCGYNVQTVSDSTVYSELAYMYYVNLGLQAYYDTSGVYQPNWGIFGNGTSNGTDHSTYGENDVGLFVNMQAQFYWIGLEYATNTGYAWVLDTNRGAQRRYIKNGEVYTWAVHPGDIAAVPEPSTYALLLTGLILLGVTTWRRTKA